jgi:KUP system potassium uptake protein
MKGQVYINGINWFLLAGCMTVLAIFEHATNMEAAYGLTITMDMLMTTALLLLYFRTKGVPRWQLVMLGMVFFTTESSFLVSNLRKFFYGGWFTFLVALTMFCLLYFFHRARSLRDKHNKLVNLEDFMPMFQALMADETIPKEATNLVFMSKRSRSGMQVDSNVIYSIFQQKPKKADVYWFVHVEILDYPQEHEKSYTVKTIIPGKVFFVRLEFGFKVRHNVNRLFKKIVQDMADNGEVDVLTRYQSMRQYHIPADFKFVFVKSMVSADNDLKPLNKLAMAIYEMLNLLNYPRHKDFGLDTLNVQEEVTPLTFHTIGELELERKSFE